MEPNSERQRGRDGAPSTLNGAIETLNRAMKICSITPAKAAFGSAHVLLIKIKESMINKQDCVELGISCADVCEALDRGLKGKLEDDLSQPVLGAIQKLTTTVAEIEGNLVEGNGRNAHAKNDKGTIAAWKLDLNRILQIFNTELAINTNTMVTEMYRNMLTDQGADSSVQSRIDKGELPPPAPRACFGRDELVGRIVGLVENLTPIALIGAGGIGKTSIALTVLHHNRVKERFGNNRRFIRCDQFTASCPNFLRRLSKVIGSNVENPEDLAPLRPSLTSKEMLIVLDNAESILDPQGANAHEISAVVEELSQIDNICLCITSRVTTVPPDCETFEIPTLSMEAACEAFHRIYKYGRQSDSVNYILEQLEFHPLSVTLLATVAHQNKWDNKRLSREWKERQTGVLQIGPNKSLARTIELSLASPMFRELGPDARGFLEVVAFFPQGIDENNLDWLFPSIYNRTTIFDTFCVLSLTYRNNGFITMLAPLRDCLRPRDPMSSRFLCATKDCYFVRMAVEIHPQTSAFRESQWIAPEDMNVEYLLDTFTSIDANSEDVWEACANFIRHLFVHKPRHTILRRKIEDLPDGPHKVACTLPLAGLFGSIGGGAEEKRLLDHTLELAREQGNDGLIALVLTELSDANRRLFLYEEGIRQAKEASEIYQRLGILEEQGRCLINLAWLLLGDGQLDDAKEISSQLVDLLPGKGQEFLVCQSQKLLSRIHCSKGEIEKAIHHLQAAIITASPFNWHDLLFQTHFCLAWLFLDQHEFDGANTHVEQAKSHAVNNTYNLAHARYLRAEIWRRQCRIEEAKSEALRAVETCEQLGAAKDLELFRDLLRKIEQAVKIQATPGQLGF